MEANAWIERLNEVISFFDDKQGGWLHRLLALASRGGFYKFGKMLLLG